MWVILLALVVAVFFIFRKFKIPKVSAICMVTGGVKSGKSTFSAYMALKLYKKQRIRYRLVNIFLKILRKPTRELPLLYSNVPLKTKYVPLTDDLLLRRKRFVYGSVIYAQEASLIADSQLCKNMDTNERLLLFNKLIGHETKGGYLIYDTQSINDNHYAVRRCVSEYFYVHDTVKWIPFVLIIHLRELRYSDDGQEINVYTEDIEESMKTVVCSKRVWKKFDCYCYSILTDHLPVERSLIDKSRDKDLKAREIVSFRNYKNGGVAREDKKNFKQIRF